ncbi:MAG: hypothetical protein QOH00_2744, partial [Gaiellales bacterium]|nr:hypothetical protein [Gaiellales bacterium]
VTMRWVPVLATTATSYSDGARATAWRWDAVVTYDDVRNAGLIMNVLAGACIELP